MRLTFSTASGMFLLFFSWFLANAFIPNVSEEYGKANYYADSLQGRKTSSGEKYDKNELTCAHKTLPFGTKVKVTRLDNKKSVVVRVIDRGPFKEGYIIELSRKAAEEVDLVRDGSASVRVEVVPDVEKNAKTVSSATSKQAGKVPAVRPQEYSTSTDPKSATSKSTASKGATSKSATSKGAASGDNAKNTELYKIDLKKSPKTGFGVQLSTLYDADNVLPIVTKLQQQWPDKVLISIERDPANDLAAYRVIVGPFKDEKTATAQQKLAAKRGYKQGFVVDLSEI